MTVNTGEFTQSEPPPRAPVGRHELTIEELPAQVAKVG